MPFFLDFRLNFTGVQMSIVDLEKLMIQMPVLPEEYEILAQKAERDTLGRLMLCRGVDAVEIDPGWFNSYQHLAIYYAIISAAESYPSVDVVTVSEELELAGNLTEVGGLPYVARVVKECSSLKVWEIKHLLKGFALMRYSMARKSESKVIVKLDDAVKNGWLRGKAWLTSKEQLDVKGAVDLTGQFENAFDWVCYAHLSCTGTA